MENKFIRNHDWLPQGWARSEVGDVYLQDGKHWEILDIDRSGAQFVKLTIEEVKQNECKRLG
jgi:hypothetical protein